MNIYIGRNGEIIGHYKLQALIAAIESGTVWHDDHAWHKGMRTWNLVREVVPPLLPLIPGRSLPDANTVEEQLPSLAS